MNEPFMLNKVETKTGTSLRPSQGPFFNEDRPSKHEVIRTRFLLRVERLVADMWDSHSFQHDMEAGRVAAGIQGRIMGELYGSLFTPLDELV